MVARNPYGDFRPPLPTGDRDFTLQVEQFPDGVHGVPVLHFGDALTLGSAIVTFKDGLWSATVQFTDETMKNLGLELSFESLELPSGIEKALVVRMHPDVEFVRELRSKWQR